MATPEQVLDLLGTLSEFQRNHLTDRDLKTLNLTCTNLDLSTGEPADGSGKFISPFPIEQVRELLAQKRPWVQYKLFPKRFNDPRADAMGILDALVGFLRFSEDGGLGLIRETEWKIRPMQYEDGEILTRYEYWPGQPGQPGPYWNVTWVLDKIDYSTPHASCLLADNALLRDDQLSNAEIWCILGITYYRLQHQWNFYNGQTIPVTVISCSDKMLRVVQGYVDGQGCIRVRKSPILNFEGMGIYSKNGKIVDVQNGLGQMELVLSWCMGATVGCTRT
ncbi:hypothetical protein F4861DRAFT_507806 [Xylaria intraflava]|nr:hypothetical protein F4861DRAFT_507806 [Xylaria intraflava]